MIIKIRAFNFFFFLLFLILEAKSENVHQEFLSKLEVLYPLEIYFEQVNKNDETIKGWMVIGGNGLARTEFASPNNLIIIADGNWLIFHDALYDRTSYLPLNRGVINALINPKKANKDYNLKVLKDSIKDKQAFRISLNREETQDELVVFFDLKKNNLLGWEIFKNNSREIKVVVKKSKKINKEAFKNNNYFIFNEEMKKKQLVFKGPFKRKLKKIPGHGKPN